MIINWKFVCTDCSLRIPNCRAQQLLVFVFCFGVALHQTAALERFQIRLEQVECTSSAAHFNNGCFQIYWWQILFKSILGQGKISWIKFAAMIVLNHFLSQVGGISNSELNSLEVELLFVLSFRLHVKRSEYLELLSELKLRHDSSTKSDQLCETTLIMDSVRMIHVSG